MSSVLYLSPHFDDAVLSCGGQIYDRTRRGERIIVATICAAPPPARLSPFAASLHARWHESGPGDFDRAAEDRAALALIGAEAIHLDIGDCIYRRAPNGEWLYGSEAAIFGELSPLEYPLVEAVVEKLAAIQPPAPNLEIIAPFGVGGHVDHRLTHRAGRRIEKSWGRRVRYYADYPYAATVAGGRPVSISEAGRRAKIEAVRAYCSQLSSFWSNEAQMTQAVGNWDERLFDHLAEKD
jgi:LmbE family N-acetylglucosaminyl deacetylase